MGEKGFCPFFSSAIRFGLIESKGRIISSLHTSNPNPIDLGQLGSLTPVWGSAAQLGKTGIIAIHCRSWRGQGSKSFPRRRQTRLVKHIIPKFTCMLSLVVSDFGIPCCKPSLTQSAEVSVTGVAGPLPSGWELGSLRVPPGFESRGRQRPWRLVSRQDVAGGGLNPPPRKLGLAKQEGLPSKKSISPPDIC